MLLWSIYSFLLFAVYSQRHFIIHKSQRLFLKKPFLHPTKYNVFSDYEKESILTQWPFLRTAVACYSFTIQMLASVPGHNNTKMIKCASCGCNASFFLSYLFCDIAHNDELALWCHNARSAPATTTTPSADTSEIKQISTRYIFFFCHVTMSLPLSHL